MTMSSVMLTKSSGGSMAAARAASGAATPIASGAGLVSLMRRNWLLGVLLAAGLVLRILTQLAYRPALLFIDSIKYLFGAYAGNDPPGYQLALKLFLRVGTLPMVVAVQHLLGLAMAVALYLILRRRGVPRWLAALATAPILLDAYQLQIEQSIMPDTAFEALIVAGLACLLWQPRPRLWMVIAAGLALGASATVRQVGEIFILPALAYDADRRPGLARQADQGRRAVRGIRPADPGDQLPELRGHQAFLARPVRRGDNLRPGRGRRRLRHAVPSPVRARALPFSRPAGPRPGLAGPRGRVTDQVRDPAGGDASRAHGGRLQPACVRAAAREDGYRDRQGRGQALRHAAGHHAPATRPSRAGGSSGPSRSTLRTSPTCTAGCGSPSSIPRAR